MSLDDLKKRISALDEDTWEELLGWVVAEEKPRREALPMQEAEKYKVIMHLRELGQIPQPDALQVVPQHVEDAPEWEHPKGEPQNCYCQGDIVQHEGRLWRSVYVHLNEGVPGVSAYWEAVEPVPELGAG